MVFENYSCEVIEDTYASSVTTIYNYCQPISQKNRAQFDVSRIILPLPCCFERLIVESKSIPSFLC